MQILRYSNEKTKFKEYFSLMSDKIKKTISKMLHLRKKILVLPEGEKTFPLQYDSPYLRRI